MWPLTIAIPTEEETKKIAHLLASILQKGDIIALFGDLGMGKTTLSKYILQSFGFEDIPSPTFTLVQTYATPTQTFYHFDLYRLKTTEEIWELGIDEAFYEGICLIEWPERLANILPETALHCYFKQEKNTSERSLVFKGPASWQSRLTKIFE